MFKSEISTAGIASKCDFKIFYSPQQKDKLTVKQNIYFREWVNYASHNS